MDKARTVFITLLFMLFIVTVLFASTSGDWKRALASNNIIEYKMFLNKHPEAKQAEMATANMNKLLEVEWEKTTIENSFKAYYQFSKYYSFAVQSNEAKRRMNAIADSSFSVALEVGNREALQSFYYNHLYSQQATAAKELIIKNYLVGTQLEDVISLLGVDAQVNRSGFGGLYIGMGVFPNDVSKKSVYTGKAYLNEYDIDFVNGKVISWKIDNNYINKERVNFNYTIK